MSTTGPGGNEELVTGYVALKEIKSLDTDHNFTDLGEASLMGMQTAIINLWNLGVTEVTTATKFDPAADMARLNMAQMMARALDHTNARPAGVNIQATAYTNAGSATLQISVTQRTADFLPVVSSPIDTFRYQTTSTVGYQAFTSSGSCGNAVATEISLTGCYIDAAEPKTDANGNLATFITAVVSATIWDYYAWTAAAGTSYDNDIHGVEVSKIAITG